MYKILSEVLLHYALQDMLHYALDPGKTVNLKNLIKIKINVNYLYVYMHKQIVSKKKMIELIKYREKYILYRKKKYISFVKKIQLPQKLDGGTVKI